MFSIVDDIEVWGKLDYFRLNGQDHFLIKKGGIYSFDVSLKSKENLPIELQFIRDNNVFEVKFFYIGYASNILNSLSLHTYMIHETFYPIKLNKWDIFKVKNLSQDNENCYGRIKVTAEYLPNSVDFITEEEK